MADGTDMAVMPDSCTTSPDGWNGAAALHLEWPEWFLRVWQRTLLMARYHTTLFGRSHWSQVRDDD